MADTDGAMRAVESTGTLTTGPPQSSVSATGAYGVGDVVAANRAEVKPVPAAPRSAAPTLLPVAQGWHPATKPRRHAGNVAFVIS